MDEQVDIKERKIEFEKQFEAMYMRIRGTYDLEKHPDLFYANCAMFYDLTKLLPIDHFPRFFAQFKQIPSPDEWKEKIRLHRLDAGLYKPEPKPEDVDPTPEELAFGSDICKVMTQLFNDECPDDNLTRAIMLLKVFRKHKKQEPAYYTSQVAKATPELLTAVKKYIDEYQFMSLTKKENLGWRRIGRPAEKIKSPIK